MPPSHYRHLGFIVSFPSMLSVKLRAREDARNEDYPHSDRVVIRKKKKKRERDSAYRTCHQKRTHAARNKLKREVSGRPRVQSSLTHFY